MVKTGNCPACGSTNEYTMMRCVDCGARLPWADAADAARKEAMAPPPIPPMPPVPPIFRSGTPPVTGPGGAQRQVFADPTNRGGFLQAFCRTCGNSVPNQAVVCLSCGCPPRKGNMFCNSCGSRQVHANAEICVNCGVRVAHAGDKSRVTAGLLGIFLGPVGVHRFYLGYTTIGIIQLVLFFLSFGFSSLWGFIEGILILAGTIDKDASGQSLAD